MRGRNGVPRKYPEITDAENSSRIPGLLDDYVVDVEVSLHKQTCLVYSPAVFPNRYRLVLSIYLDDYNLLVRPFRNSNLLDSRWRQAVPDQAFRSFRILHYLDLPACHAAQLVDVFPAFPDSKAHITWLCYKDDPS